MDIATRDATEADAEFVAWVQLAAARSHVEIGFWDLVFNDKPDDAEILRNMVGVVAARARSFSHWSGFRIAEVDGVPAAGLSGYEPAKVTDEVMGEALLEAATTLNWAPEVLGNFGERAAPFLECIEPAPADHWVVEWVATKAEFRGKGLVKRLLHEMLERGRERGFRHAQISVLLGNTPAERAYEGIGFRTFDDKTSPAFEAAMGAAGLRRMRMDL